MSERDYGTYIPGDDIALDLGQFRHRQHLDGVSVIYVRASTRQEIVLRGTPQEIGGSNAADDPYRSSAIVGGTIPANASAGRYVLGEIVAYTYGGEERRFADVTDEHITARQIPRSITVEREPTDPPTFV